MKNNEKIISLFCGAGGMSLGFTQAGIKPCIAAEIDPDACNTYHQNLGIKAIQTDLAEKDDAVQAALGEARNALAIIGGPPCQGFSSAGRKNGKDQRNKLIFEYLGIVEYISPRWFLLENVEGLLTSNDGESLHYLVREFIKLGYRVRLEKVNFAAYGLPQGRKRVILIGNRLGAEFDFPVATHSFNAGKHKHINGLPLAPSVDDALAGLGPSVSSGLTSPYTADQPLNKYDRLMRSGNDTNSVTQHSVSVPPHLSEALAQLKPGGTMKDLPREFWHDSFKRRAFRRVMDGTPTEKRGGAPSGIKRLHGDLNALTITSAATREFIHPHEDRPLSMRECARLQSFPDSFQFNGNAGSVIRQIGNAFPPLAARIFADHLLQLDGAFGADGSNIRRSDPGLIGYRLTDASGMSPALARTDALLNELAARQAELSAFRLL